MRFICSFFFVFLSVTIWGQIEKTFSIEGVSRKCIVYEPQQKTEKSPVVFVFHGHGGTMKHASKVVNFQDEYPEAVVVFMQGIPGTSGYVVDKEGLLSGWQMFPNDSGNRDVLFFDEALKDVQKNYKIDVQKIYLVGHSNGARFVNVLWKERGNLLAGIISVAAQGGLMIKGAEPISVWMSMGKNDPLVSYDFQKKSIPIVMRNLGIDAIKVQMKGDLKFYNGNQNTELIVEERNAGHEFPQESIPEMVAFMKRNSKIKEFEK